MRKPWWILSAIVMFVVIDVHAETLAQCKSKCTSVSDDSCNVCCYYRDNAARNRCGMDAVKELGKCRQAGKTPTADQECDAAFEKRATECWDENTELDLAKFTCPGQKSSKRD